MTLTADTGVGRYFFKMRPTDHSGAAIDAALKQEQTMDVPKDRKYSETHEWYLLDNDVVTMGITQYAADELSDLTYVQLPTVGITVSPGDSIGEVESVKATSDVMTAVGGEVIEVNTELADHPELINDSAFDQGWLVKIRVSSGQPLSGLMDAKAYTRFVQASAG